VNLDSAPAGPHNPPIDDEGVSNIFNTDLPDLDPHFLDELLTNLDSYPYALMFGDVPVNTDSTWDLEYFGIMLWGQHRLQQQQETSLLKLQRSLRNLAWCVYLSSVYMRILNTFKAADHSEALPRVTTSSSSSFILSPLHRGSGTCFE
jgi:hypothetical protein